MINSKKGLRKMLKRTLCTLLAALMMLSVSGCTGGSTNTEPVVQVEPSDTTGPAGNTTEPPAPEATEPNAEKPIAPAATDPTEIAPSEPSVSEPDMTAPAEDVTDPVVTEPADPPATELTPTDAPVTEPAPTDPPATEAPTAAPDTEAPTTKPAPTDPPATEPPATETPTKAPETKPVVTEPPTTKPAATEPPATEHVHDYSAKVVKPTCTKKGYTKYTCKCGDSYKDDYVDKLAHSYTSQVVKPTCEKKGYTLYTCQCGESYKDNYTEKTAHSYTSKVVKPTCEKKGYTLYTCQCGESYKDNYTDAGEHNYKASEVVEATMWEGGYTTYVCKHCGNSYKGNKTNKISQKEFERQVAEAVVKYINQYRADQGDTKAQILPGLTLVAEYRAVQLIDNFEHSTKDLREAYAYYQYGEWHDNTEFGGSQYYSANAKEAIAYTAGGGVPADLVGSWLAKLFRESPNHWSYVGSSNFPYIGIGVTRGPDYWYCCVLQTRDNFG